jgi:hypothetical protein
MSTRTARTHTRYELIIPSALDPPGSPSSSAPFLSPRTGVRLWSAAAVSQVSLRLSMRTSARSVVSSHLQRSRHADGPWAPQLAVSVAVLHCCTACWWRAPPDSRLYLASCRASVCRADADLDPARLRKRPDRVSPPVLLAIAIHLWFQACLAIDDLNRRIYL